MNGRIGSGWVLALWMTGSLILLGCKGWERDVVRNGIHFEKIHQSAAGTHVGLMSADQEIQDFPCAKGWIHFRGNGELLSFQLSREHEFMNLRLPAQTWIHFPQDPDQGGYACVFPHALQVQGYLCRGGGGFKGIQTGFHPGGMLRSFFPPEDVLVDGVPCAASLLHAVRLHENGRIQGCRLAADHVQGGESYPKGRVLAFDINGGIE
jgi:hypothetical protein